MRITQMQEWTRSEHGRILKNYKEKWDNNRDYLTINCKNIIDIRKMRIGCSDLVGHCDYKYRNKIRCPGCDHNILETNEHYIMECSRYGKEREELFEDVGKYIPQKEITTKTLLGFQTNNNNNQKNLRKILEYLSKYIEKTQRFRNPTWIRNKKKVGIG